MTKQEKRNRILEDYCSVCGKKLKKDQMVGEWGELFGFICDKKDIRHRSYKFRVNFNLCTGIPCGVVFWEYY